jgi:hypothetical protein
MNVLQQLGDLIVIMVTIGLALYGWQHGLFLATLAGMQRLEQLVLENTDITDEGAKRLATLGAL